MHSSVKKQEGIHRRTTSSWFSMDPSRVQRSFCLFIGKYYSRPSWGEGIFQSQPTSDGLQLYSRPIQCSNGPDKGLPTVIDVLLSPLLHPLTDNTSFQEELSLDTERLWTNETWKVQDLPDVQRSLGCDQTETLSRTRKLQTVVWEWVYVLYLTIVLVASKTSMRPLPRCPKSWLSWRTSLQPIWISTYLIWYNYLPLTKSQDARQ